MIKVYFVKFTEGKYHIGVTAGEIQDALSHVEASYPESTIMEMMEFNDMQKARVFRKSVVSLFADHADIEFIGGKAVQIFNEDVLDLEDVSKNVKIFTRKNMVTFQERIKRLKKQRV